MDVSRCSRSSTIARGLDAWCTFVHSMLAIIDDCSRSRPSAGVRGLRRLLLVFARRLHAASQIACIYTHMRV